MPDHDRRWFDDLFTAHAGAVLRFLRRRMPSGAVDAEDLAADVLATAWRRRDDVPDGHELAWLYRTAGFVLANHRRRAAAVPLAEMPEPRADDVPDLDPAALAVTDDAVRRALAALSPRDRTILVLCAWEGVGGDDLAVVLGTSRGGADAALSRARSRLRAVWAEVSDDEGPARSVRGASPGRPGTRTGGAAGSAAGRTTGRTARDG
ncbi:RNA polymerase sigma-70 factor (ECF subfamily) [Sediminihabitans luteus]|uniref:RNA polymerase sigma-70 factor (ECF subfamily) n=1 Tax=Sediminihabitans luteus TaxID=1138585 RepID=A0A2M9CEK1_9CELL|nr:sigma-70 family RNA polymerase sigma factor [Sediminihabitans luteus]PJJ70280.1 RNA polymerase sigma-70 factor (ECF subfamily) [Sediminihabitans luteus]GII97751.1 DNA-directed RNA polymerase sigma-70 factor [Sediminihabitans luteus]